MITSWSEDSDQYFCTFFNNFRKQTLNDQSVWQLSLDRFHLGQNIAESSTT